MTTNFRRRKLCSEYLLVGSPNLTFNKIYAIAKSQNVPLASFEKSPPVFFSSESKLSLSERQKKTYSGTFLETCIVLLEHIIIVTEI